MDKKQLARAAEQWLRPEAVVATLDAAALDLRIALRQADVDRERVWAIIAELLRRAALHGEVLKSSEAEISASAAVLIEAVELAKDWFVHASWASPEVLAELDRGVSWQGPIEPDYGWPTWEPPQGFALDRPYEAVSVVDPDVLRDLFQAERATLRQPAFGTTGPDPVGPGDGSDDPG